MRYGEGFSPSPSEFEINPLPTEEKPEKEDFEDEDTRKFLRRVARNTIVTVLATQALVHGNREIGRLKFERNFGDKAEATELLASKEQKIKELFGDNYSYNADLYRNNLSGERKEHEFMGAFTEASTDMEALDPNYRYPESEGRGSNVEVSDVKYLGGELKGESLRKIAQETFPKNWVKGEVSQITQEGEPDFNMDEYGLREGWVTLATCGKDDVDNSRKSKIEFYQVSNEQSRQELFGRVLAHEFAHANDWERDNEMSTTERADLILAIAKRLESEDRYKSDYVESINNSDKQKERYYKATEYWAEICSAYFNNPDSLNVQDWFLVHENVKKSDPSFDARQKKEQRVNLIHSSRQ